MENTEREISTFKAIVKGIGIYHLILGAASFYRIILGKAGIAFTSVADWQKQRENAAWLVFEWAVAFVLLFWTDALCRMVFRKPDGGA
jgi:hypothetical protein